MSLFSGTSATQRQLGALSVGLAAILVATSTANLWVIVAAVMAFEMASAVLVRACAVTSSNTDRTWISRSQLMGLGVVVGLVAAAICLVSLTGEMELSALQQALKTRLADDKSNVEVSLGLIVGKLTAVLVGVVSATLLGSAPVQPRLWDLADRVAPWLAILWSCFSRLLGLVLVWRIGIQTLTGLELESLVIAMSFSLLSLAWGSLSLWQREDLRGLLCRIATLQTGLIWLAIASVIAETTQSQQSLVGGVFISGCWPAVALIVLGSVASLVVCGVEQGLVGSQGRITFQAELTGLGRSQPLAGWCLAAALFALTPLPPLTGFWTWFWLLGTVLIPGIPTIEQAAASPNPAVLAGMLVAIGAMIPLTLRVMQIVIEMFLHEPLGRRQTASDSWSFALTVAGAACLVLTGVFPGLALALFSRM